MTRNKKQFKQGFREDIGIYVRSEWEAVYARYLNFLIKNKEIKSWEYEPKTFWFENIRRGVRSYTPDFLIINNNGSEEYHEVKGYMDSRSATKLKRMKKYYPEIKMVLIDGDFIKDIKRKLGRIVED
jgi:hypothetical protein